MKFSIKFDIVKAGWFIIYKGGHRSLILARSHTFVEIDHEIISTAILLPSSDSRRVVVRYQQRYMLQVLVSNLVKLAQEKSVVRLTDHADMTIAVN